MNPSHRSTRKARPRIDTPAGRTLAQLLAERGWSESELSRRCKDAGGYVSQAQISNLIRGHAKLSLAVAFRLAQGLEIDPARLVPFAYDAPANLRSATYGIPGYVRRLTLHRFPATPFGRLSGRIAHTIGLLVVPPPAAHLA
jgi:transcriptional regulator with XRE-family HTH domain